MDIPTTPIPDLGFSADGQETRQSMFVPPFRMDKFTLPITAGQTIVMTCHLPQKERYSSIVKLEPKVGRPLLTRQLLLQKLAVKGLACYTSFSLPRQTQAMWNRALGHLHWRCSLSAKSLFQVSGVYGETIAGPEA
jgi:hypothetical protein